MKTRQGFVSNSSSSSFIIQKKSLTAVQLDLIKRHIEIANRINEVAGERDGTRRFGGYPIMADGNEGSWNDNIILGRYYANESDAWSIHEYEDRIEGSTSMNNFDMEVYLREIGVPVNAVKFEGE